MLQSGAMRCTALQHVAVRFGVFHLHSRFRLIEKMLVCCSVLQGVTVRCSALQHVALTLEARVD